MQITEDIIRGFDQINASWRIIKRAENKGLFFAEAIDRTTRKVYAEASAGSEEEAVINLLEIATKAPKPLTKAQLNDPNIHKIEELQAQLEESQSMIEKLKSDQNPKPKRGRGRPPKSSYVEQTPEPGYDKAGNSTNETT